MTEKAKWAKPNLKACKPVITISDLDKVTVTASKCLVHSKYQSLGFGEITVICNVLYCSYGMHALP